MGVGPPARRRHVHPPLRHGGDRHVLLHVAPVHARRGRRAQRAARSADRARRARPLLRVPRPRRRPRRGPTWASRPTGGRASSRPVTPRSTPTARSRPRSCPRRPPATARWWATRAARPSSCSCSTARSRRAPVAAATASPSVHASPPPRRVRPSSCSCGCRSISAGGRWLAPSSTATRWRASRCAWRTATPRACVLTLRDGATALAVSRTLHVGPR